MSLLIYGTDFNYEKELYAVLIQLLDQMKITHLKIELGIKVETETVDFEFSSKDMQRESLNFSSIF